MTIEKTLDACRKTLRELHEGFRRGDIPKKRFERQRENAIVDLYRALAGTRLAREEEILEEHHVVRAHLKLTQSVLREQDEEAISLFLTPHRLIHVRAVFGANQLITGDARDGTKVEAFALGDVSRLVPRKEIRSGEAIAGAVICVVAFLFRRLLLVTGTLLLILGLLGIVHGLLLPTRWIEAEIDGLAEDDKIRIYGVRKKSARRLLRVLRGRYRS
jgi:hypothetical protein